MTAALPAGVHEHPLLRDAQGRLDLKSLPREAVEAWLDALGMPPGAALRVYKRLWQRAAPTFLDMDGVARPLRERLAEVAYVSHLERRQVQRSSDGTVKLLWGLEDGLAVESVLIPEEERGALTLCVSSQVGCAMGCAFCLTGDMGFARHLKPSEIANQALQAAAVLEPGRRITNIVFMGMGEPLHNLDNVVAAVSILLDDHALNLSHRKVTVSTVGLVSRMSELAARTPVNLAVSINATTEEQRLGLMPITRRHSLAELIQACRDFPLPPGKRITFEYVMFAGINDTLDDAARLFALLEGIKAKVNLIPYNENPDRPYRSPSAAVVKAFHDYFVSRGLSCSVRASRGQDISAACGQLGREAAR